MVCKKCKGYLNIAHLSKKAQKELATDGVCWICLMFEKREKENVPG